MIEFLDDTHMIWDVRVAIDQFLGAIGAGLADDFIALDHDYVKMLISSPVCGGH